MRLNFEKNLTTEHRVIIINKIQNLSNLDVINWIQKEW